MTSELRKVKDPDFGKREPDREQDAILDQKIFGHETQWALWGNREMPFRQGWHDHGMPYSVPYYHSRIQDAWLIVEALIGRFLFFNIPAASEEKAAKAICEEARKALKIT